MENIPQYIGVALGLGIFVWGMIGFYRGLSLPKNQYRLDHSGDTL